MHNLEKTIRKLAKGNKYQGFLDASKALSGIQMFKNTYDFSYIQQIFLGWVSFYYNLNQDVSLKEVSEKVLQDDIYADAYSLWKSKKGNKTERNEVKKPHALNISFGGNIKEVK